MTLTTLVPYAVAFVVVGPAADKFHGVPRAPFFFLSILFSCPRRVLKTADVTSGRGPCLCASAGLAPSSVLLLNVHGRRDCRHGPRAGVVYRTFTVRILEYIFVSSDSCWPEQMRPVWVYTRIRDVTQPAREFVLSRITTGGAPRVQASVLS